MARKQYAANSSNHTTSTRDSRRSNDSYDHYSQDSRSTAPSSFYDSLGSTKAYGSRATKQPTSRFVEDLPTSTSLDPRSSVETYSSKASLEEQDGDSEVDEDVVYDTAAPTLPIYRHEIIDANVRPSSPEGFASLFPSMNRLSIKHDDFTSDGNMNLRVDTIVSGRRRRTIQLFHLRMYDLNKREFSLRRYCRDSGREVCNSKRKYTEPASQGRPKLQRSMSNAMKSLVRPQLRQTSTSGSMFSNKSRPGTSHSMFSTEEDSSETRVSLEKRQKAPQLATNVIKLEFSNYARVDVERRGSKGAKRYEFDWWGHKYAWRRVTDKLTGVVSFHLFRQGLNSTPVAHIVPETRSPNQIVADERAGGWVPPCHMWLSDEELINAMTDIADVVVATGLMALVDDCIKERWGTKNFRPQRIGLPARSNTTEFEHTGTKSFVQQLFSRRNSDHSRPLRHTPHPVTAY